MKVEALIELLQALPKGTVVLMYDSEVADLTPVMGIHSEEENNTVEIF